MGQKNFGTEKILGPKKFWVQKHFGSKKILGPKNVWVKKNFWLKNFGSKKIVGQKNLGLQNILSQKILVPLSYGIGLSMVGWISKGGLGWGFHSLALE